MMNAASSDARNTTAAAMSSGIPWRPSAVFSRYASTMPDRPQRLGRGRPHEARRDGVDPDPAWTELERGDIHQGDDAGLGRAVGRHPSRRLHGIHTGDGDDRPGISHHPRCSLDGQEGAGEGDVEDSLPVSEGVVDDGRRDAAPGVRHRDVEPAEAVNGERRKGCGPLLDRDVAPHDRTRLAERVRYRAQTVLRDVPDDDATALVDDALGNGATDAGRAAGDDRDLAVETSHAVPRDAGQPLICARSSAHCSAFSSATTAMRRHRSSCPPGICIPNDVRVRNSSTTTPSGPAS